MNTRDKRIAAQLASETDTLGATGSEWEITHGRAWKVAALTAALQAAYTEHRGLPPDCPAAGPRQRFAPEEEQPCSR